MKRNPDNLCIKAQAGFSLVDVLVGMVIALLGVIIMFQVFSVSESMKRTTTSGGDALQNGATSLFMLERSLRQAGYGIFASNQVAPFPADLPGTAAVTITAGAANQSDTIVLRYRENWEYGSFPPDSTAFVSAVPPALTLETISVNPAAQLVTSTAPDAAPPYTTLLPAAAATGPTVISDGIVLLKAQYGTDVDGDGVISAAEWLQTPPGGARVMAVRIAVVARSAQPEKPDPVSGLCATTNAFPSWAGSGSVPLNLSANLGLNAATDDWKCYRYKTFESTVPLRNR